MITEQGDTIAAVATPMGYGGIGIVRVSGPGAGDVLKKVFRIYGKTQKLESHRIVYGHIINSDSNPVDEVMAVLMCAPRSYTREDVAEIHCHGGLRAVEAVLSVVLENGVRLAEPGEFTKRAFLNGRLDLTQAEAVKDVINAKTDLARQASVNQLTGSLSKRVREYSDMLLSLLARMEVSIDYPEHDMEEMNLRDVSQTAQNLLEKIECLLKDADRGKMIRDGIETVILGRPNVGKSSLLNRLLDEDRAIVTDIPGTTRDILQETVSLGNLALLITDTAGIRDTDDVIERIGVEKARQYAEKAQLILLLVDASREIDPGDVEMAKAFGHKRMLVLFNKTDLPQLARKEDLAPYLDAYSFIETSMKDGSGLDKLRKKVMELFFDGEIAPDDAAFCCNVRHKNALRLAAVSLRNAIEGIEWGMTEDLVSIDLRQCYHHLGEITGETADADIIDRIFSDFCVGK